MKTKNILCLLAIAGLMVGSLAATAAQLRVAVVASGPHATEFDSALQALGIQPDRFDQKKCGDLAAGACANYDAVLVPPVTTLDAKKVDRAKWLAWLEQGGLLMTSQNGLNWLGDGFKFTNAWGKCNSDQWGINGWVTNTVPAHPLRFFPDALREGNSWPHFSSTSLPPGWEIAGNCSEGLPVTVVKRVGKGLAIVSMLRQASAQQIGNAFANLALSRAGAALKSFELTAPAVGPGKLTLGLAAAPQAPVTFTYEILGPDGKTQNRFAMKVADGAEHGLPFHITARGPVTCRFSVNGTTLFARPAVLPPPLAVAPRAVRGLLSVNRRSGNARFDVRIVPDTDKVEGSRLTVRVLNAAGQVVAESAPVVVSVTNLDFTVALPLSRDLPAGAYRVESRLDRGWFRRDYVASSGLTILAAKAAQTVIDEDNTFITGGKPFFPLGIYHVKPRDYAKVAALGMNLVQFWQWDGVAGMDALTNHQMRAMFESTFKTDENITGQIKLFESHPGLFAWYTIDEPAEGAEGLLTMLQNTFHQNDTNHPTILASARSDLFPRHAEMVDVLGLDPYSGPECCDAWMAKATAATKGRQPVVCVQASFGGESNGVLRASAFLALAHDARGIIWYPWEQVGGGPVGIGLIRHPWEQEEMKALLADIKPLFPALLSDDRVRYSWGTIRGLLCTVEGKRTLILANASKKPAEADVTLPGDGAPKHLSLQGYGTDVIRW